MVKQRQKKAKAVGARGYRQPRVGDDNITIKQNDRSFQTTVIHRWDQTMHSITSSSASQANSAWAFTLGDVQGATDITNMWDQYQIVQVDVLFIPQNTVGAALGTATGPCLIYVAVDQDDNTITTTTEIQQYGNLQVHGMNEKWTLSFKPRASQALYTAGAFSGYALLPVDSWVDAGSTTVQYYGLKIAVPQTTSPNVQTGALCFRYTIRLRATH